MKLNVGLLYEAIVRRVASATVDGRDKSAASSVRLARRFFGAGKPLNAELREHLALFNARGLAPGPAADVLARVRERVCGADNRAVVRDARLCEHVVHGEMGEKLSVCAADWERHAAVAALFHAWRSKDPGRIAVRESAVTKLLTSPLAAPTPEPQLTPHQHMAAARAVQLFERKWSGRVTPAHARLLAAAASGASLSGLVAELANGARADLLQRSAELEPAVLEAANQLASAGGPATVERGLALADLRAQLAGEACTLT